MPLQVAKIKSLEYLYACFCPLQNEGLTAIVNGCPNLKHASVDGCWISTLCMLRIVRQRPHLTMWLKGISLWADRGNWEVTQSYVEHVASTLCLWPEVEPSALCVRAHRSSGGSRAEPGCRAAGDSALPNIVFKVDTVLTAAPEPYCRRSAFQSPLRPNARRAMLHGVL